MSAAAVLRTALLAVLHHPNPPPQPGTAVTPRYPDGYAPGTIRRATDSERAAVVAFTDRHPEYAKLSQDEIVQAMSTYRTVEDHEDRQRLSDAGVPADWRRGDEDGEMVGL